MCWLSQQTTRSQKQKVRLMSIDNRCREQRDVADQMFMDFKYTQPGSKEQIRALMTLSFLIGMWADFLDAEVERMTAAISLMQSN